MTKKETIKIIKSILKYIDKNIGGSNTFYLDWLEILKFNYRYPIALFQINKNKNQIFLDALSNSNIIIKRRKKNTPKFPMDYYYLYIDKKYDYTALYLVLRLNGICI